MKRPEQYHLQGIFERLNDRIFCRYTRNGDYPIAGEDGEIILLHPLELLEVGKQYPKEHVMLAYFGDKPTRVRYFGEDTESMKETIKNMRLPRNWSDNLGERVFIGFRDTLEDMPQGYISLEQRIRTGKEVHFRHLFKKLIAVYKEHDALLQAASNSVLSGETSN